MAQTQTPAGGAASPPSAEPAPEADVLTSGRSGSDFMVDVIKSLGFDYVCANPGSSFRGLQESIVNYGGNTRPEFLTCCHEESSVAMAHGYSKIEGKPLAILAHGTVGLQHASMAIYNACCDRVPVYIILGNTLDAVDAVSGRRVAAQRAGRRRHGARLRQMGRHAGVAAALRRVRRARLQGRDDAAGMDRW